MEKIVNVDGFEFHIVNPDREDKEIISENEIVEKILEKYEEKLEKHYTSD